MRLVFLTGEREDGLDTSRRQGRPPAPPARPSLWSDYRML